jgi:hypothetical protein
VEIPPNISLVVQGKEETENAGVKVSVEENKTTRIRNIRLVI